MRPQTGVGKVKHAPPMQANDLPVVAQAVSPAYRILSQLLTVGARIGASIGSKAPPKRGCHFPSLLLTSSQQQGGKHVWDPNCRWIDDWQGTVRGRSTRTLRAIYITGLRSI